MDFSSNINPAAPPRFINEALAECDYTHYPDYAYAELSRAIAKFHGVEQARIIPVNGASEGLYASILVAKLLGFHKCAIISPNYGDLEFEEYCRILGLKATHWVMEAVGDSYRLGSVEVNKDQVVVLSNPNNPTGVLLLKNDIIAIAQSSGLLIVDEAYINLSDDPSQSVVGLDADNVVVVRSLTKELGLPGLRLGYVYSANSKVIETMRLVLPSWNVNSCAERVGILTFSKYANDYAYFLKESRRLIFELRRVLMDGLLGLGFRVFKSSANYLLAEAPISAETLYSKLLKRGIVIRRPIGFVGLSDRHVRIAVRGLSDVERLISAIKEILRGT